MPSLCPPARRSANEPAKRRRQRVWRRRRRRSPTSVPETGSGAYGEVGESEPRSGAGAVKRTRTSTPVKELAPQASASTNSAMTARKPRVLRREAEARRLAKRFGHDKRAGGAGARLRLSSKVFQKFQFLPRIRRTAGAATPTAVAIPGAESNLFKDFRPIFRALVACRSGGPNLSALMPRSDATRRVAKRARAGSGADVCGNPRARNQPFQGLPPDFPGACRLPKRRTEPLRPHAQQRRNASRRGAGSGRQRRRRLWQTRARNQPFQGLPLDFPGACRLPKRRTEPLRPHAEERRIASRREAGSGRQRRRRLWQTRARNQPFQGLPPDFPGARRLPKRRTEPLRPHAEERRNASRGEAGSGRQRRRRLWQSRARNQPFQGLPPDFPGARRLPKRRTEPLRPHAEERRNASRREAGSGRQRRRRLRQSRARNSTFSRTSARFSGRSSPAETADRTVPPSCRGAMQRVASRSRLDQAAAFELAGASCDRLGARSRASWSHSKVSNFATRGSVGGCTGGGAALRQADTGGVLVVDVVRTKAEHNFFHMARHCWIFPAAPGRGAGHSRQGTAAAGRGVVRDSAVSAKQRSFCETAWRSRCDACLSWSSWRSPGSRPPARTSRSREAPGEATSFLRLFEAVAIRASPWQSTGRASPPAPSP